MRFKRYILLLLIVLVPVLQLQLKAEDIITYKLHISWLKIGIDGVEEDRGISPILMLSGPDVPAYPYLEVDEGYHLVKWTLGEVDYSIGDGIRLTKEDTIVAIWEINKYTVVTKSNNELYGLASDTADYYYNDNVTLGIDSVMERCNFRYWDDTLHALKPETKDYTFLLDKSQEHGDTVLFMAVFAPDSVLLTVNTECDTCGFVRLEYDFDGTHYLSSDWKAVDTTRYEWDDCPANRNKFSGLRLYARPKYGYEFESWLKNGVVLTNDTTDTIYAPVGCDEDTVVYTAKFRPKKYPILLRHEVWADGVVYTMPDGAQPASTDSVWVPDRPVFTLAPTAADSVFYGDTAYLKTVPDTLHYIFKGWQNNLGKLNTDSTIVVLKADTFVAIYEPKKFKVTIQTPDTALGHIAGADPTLWTMLDLKTDKQERTEYYYTTIDLVPTPADCYVLDSLQSNGIIVDSSFPIEQDSVITATFKQKEWLIKGHPNDPSLGEVYAEYNGVVYNDGVIADTLHCGDTFKLIPIAKDSCHFVEWDWDNTLPDTVTITIKNDSPEDYTGNFIPNIRLTLRAEVEDGTLGGGIFVIDTLRGKLYDNSTVNPWSWFVLDSTKLNITAREVECYRFEHWKETNSPDSILSNIEITENTELTAVFSKVVFNIRIALFDETLNDTISVETEMVDCGEVSKTLSKHSSDCYDFVRWEDDPLGTLPEERVLNSVQCDTALIAHFTHKKPTITVASSDINLGTVQIDGINATTAQQYCDSLLTLHATPTDDCYKFVSWSDGSTDSIHLITVGSTDMTYTATFDTIKYTLTVNVSPTEGGTVPATLTGEYVCGTSIPAFAVTPAPECFTFLGWSDGETDLTHSAVTMDEDKTITAQFEQQKDTLTLLVPRKGSIRDVVPNIGSVVYESRYSDTILVEKNCGEVFDVQIRVDNPCFLLEGWDYDNDGTIDTAIDTTDLTTSYTGTLTKGNEKITLRTRKAKFHVQIIFDPEQGSPWWAPGKPGVTNNEWIECGSIQLFGSPKGCYEFDHWQYGSNPANTGTEWNGIYISSDTVFYAFYKQRSWNITFGPNNAEYGRVEAEYLGQPATSPLPTMYCDSSFTLTPIAESGYRFLGWSDGSTDSVRHIVVNNSTPQNFTAYFGKYITLTVETRDGNDNLGGGKIVSVLGGGSNPITEMYKSDNLCRYMMEVNTPVTIEVDEINCYDFSGWRDDGSLGKQRSITLTDDAVLTALFTEKQYTVTVVCLDENGDEFSRETNSVKCEGDITVNCCSDYCYMFNNWEDLSTATSVSLTEVKADTILKAYYTRLTRTLTVSAGANGSVSVARGDGVTYSVSAATSPSFTIPCGTDITLTAEPESQCYRFDSWNGDTSQPSTISFNLRNDATYSAAFADNDLSISVNIVPAEAGTFITDKPTYKCGETATITLTVDPCYTFNSWADNGSTVLTRTILIDANTPLVYTANYDVIPYSVTVGVKAGSESLGDVSPKGTFNADCGSLITLTATPFDSDLYILRQWWKDGVATGNSDASLVVTVDANVTYEAEFARAYTVNVVCLDTAGNDVTGVWAEVISGKGQFAEGMNLQVEVNSLDAKGYYFWYWQDDPGSDPKSMPTIGNPRTITVSNDITLYAYFNVYKYNVTVALDGIYGNPILDGTVGNEIVKKQYPYLSQAVIDLQYDDCLYKFNGWEESTDNGVTYTQSGNTDLPRTVTVTDNIIYRGTMKDHLYRIDAVVDSTNLGYIEAQYNGVAHTQGDPIPDLVCGDNAQFTVVLNDPVNTVFLGWDDLTNTDNPRSFPYISPAYVTGDDMTMVAHLDWNYYNVTVVCDAAAGVATGAGRYRWIDNATISLTTNYGYTFLHWQITEDETGNTYQSADNPYVITDHVSRTLTAVFERNQYTLTLNVNDANYGSASIDGDYNISQKTYYYQDVSHLEAQPKAGFEFVGWSNGEKSLTTDISIVSDTIIEAVFRRIPYSIYVTRTDTVCDSNRYTLHDQDTAHVFTLSGNKTVVRDTIEFIHDGVTCKRIYYITVLRRRSFTMPDIEVLPKAYYRDTLYLNAATNDIDEKIASSISSLSPLIYDSWWEILSEDGQTFTRYTMQMITQDTVVLRYSASSSCGVMSSNTVEVPVVRATPESNIDCDKGVVVTVSDSGAVLSVDLRQMHLMNYDFPADSVRWYRVVNQKDSVEGKVHDDELLSSGYNIRLRNLRIEQGNYYCLISLPQQDSIVACSGVLSSDVFTYLLPQIDEEDEWQLLPTMVKGGEQMTLIGLKTDKTYSLRMYSVVGQILMDKEVTGVRFYDISASYPVGVYVLYVKTEDKKQAFKFVIKK